MLRPLQARAAGIGISSCPRITNCAAGRAQGRAAEAEIRRTATYPAPMTMFEAARRYPWRRLNRREWKPRPRFTAGAVSRALPADRSVEKHGGSLRKPETRGNQDLRAADGLGAVAQSAPRLQVIRDAESRSAQHGFAPLRAHVVGAGTMGADIANVPSHSHPESRRRCPRRPSIGRSTRERLLPEALEEGCGRVEKSDGAAIADPKARKRTARTW